jgi:hypothetical protein
MWGGGITAVDCVTLAENWEKTPQTIFWFLNELCISIALPEAVQ